MEHEGEGGRDKGRYIDRRSDHQYWLTMRSSVAVMLVAVAGSSSAFTIPPAAFTTSLKSASRSRSSCFSTEPSTTSARRHSLSYSSSPAASPAGQLRMSAAEVEAPAVASGEEESIGQAAPVDIPTSLPSEAGIDYVPLATMLATGDLKGADQFTRDALIKAAGAGSQKREFVYWTEVKNIPK